MSDLVYLFVRPDATGYYAQYAGFQLTSEPGPRDVYEAICKVGLNGSQWELVPAADVDGQP